jgi:hypothetical protein
MLEGCGKITHFWGEIGKHNNTVKAVKEKCEAIPT